MTQSTRLKDSLVTYAWLTIGALIYAIGINCCYVPNQIGMGGVTGIAQLIHALIPALPMGILIIVLNLPLFFLGWKYIGGHLLVTSLYTMLVSSLIIDGITLFFGEIPPMEPILASIYGGILVGFSLGLVFLKGATTGGTDIMARLLKLKLAWLPLGKIMLVVDVIVLVSVSIVFDGLDALLYGMIGLVLSSQMIDKVLYGLDHAKVAYIICNCPDEVTQALYQVLDRGVTLLQGEGGYSREKKEVIMCAFKQRQIVQLKALVIERDPTAFLIVCDAHDVLGEGFRMFQKNEI